MDSLTQKKCTPCEGGAEPLTKEEAEKYLEEVSGWELAEEARKIRRGFRFGDFVQAMTFVNKVAERAEDEGHHPDIHISYNKVALELWTHKIGGLSENDFILAAKIGEL